MANKKLIEARGKLKQLLGEALRGPYPSQIYLCPLCLGVWSDMDLYRNMEAWEVRAKQSEVWCRECDCPMSLYNRASPTLGKLRTVRS